MAGREIHLELLLGRRVVAPDGKPIGRIEEVCAEAQGSDLVVTEYHVGAYAMAERLSASRIGRAILDLFHPRPASRGYRVPWDKLDLSDPKHPRLTCPAAQLALLEA